PILPPRRVLGPVWSALQPPPRASSLSSRGATPWNPRFLRLPPPARPWGFAPIPPLGLRPLPPLGLARFLLGLGRLVVIDRRALRIESRGPDPHYSPRACRTGNQWPAPRRWGRPATPARSGSSCSGRTC